MFSNLIYDKNPCGGDIQDILKCKILLDNLSLEVKKNILNDDVSILLFLARRKKTIIKMQEALLLLFFSTPKKSCFSTSMKDLFQARRVNRPVQ